MDEFGKSDRVRDPPTCLVTVYATIGPNTTPHLSYCVPVEGVVSNMNEIFINRLLEQPNLSQGTHLCITCCIYCSCMILLLVNLKLQYIHVHTIQ